MEHSDWTELVRTVSASPSEYARGLHQAVPGGVTGGPLHFAVCADDMRIQIDLIPGPDHVIALLRLPSLTATWRLTGGSAESRQALVAKMDLAMRRGGG